MSDLLSKGVKRILLLDDEKSVLFALKLLLEAIGYSVTDFCSPEEAIEFLRGNDTPQLIICDLRMPKLNGIDVLRETKSIRPGLPFVLMSAHAGTDEVNEAKALGAFGFLAKPFTPDQLNELVARIDESSPLSEAS